MSRGIPNSSNYLSRSGALSGWALPLSFACWGFPTIDTGTEAIVMSVSDDTSNNMIWLGLDQYSTNNRAYLMHRGGGGSSLEMFGPTNVSMNAWVHLGARISAVNSRHVFTNGVSSAENTDATNALGALIRLATGVRYIATVGNRFGGYFGEVAVWNVALTDAEFLALSRGVSPLRIRRANLIFYSPHYRGDASGNEADYSGGGLHLTETGTVGVGNHPPVMPGWGLDIARPYVAGAGVTYTYVASGGLTLSDSALLSKTKAATASGGLQLSGSAVLSRVKDWLASGGITLSGLALISRTKDFISSGGIVSSGDALTEFLAVEIWNYIASGGITSSGTASISKTKSFASLGGLVCSGSARTSFRSFVSARRRGARDFGFSMRDSWR